jgi:hypothetical protein
MPHRAVLSHLTITHWEGWRGVIISKNGDGREGVRRRRRRAGAERGGEDRGGCGEMRRRSSNDERGSFFYATLSI